jgi:hypothetical protein
MNICKKGIFNYIDSVPDKWQTKLPASIQIQNITSEALLLRSLLGQIKIGSEKKTIHHKYNYLILPFTKTKRLIYKNINKDLNNIFVLNNLLETIQLDKYFNSNRKNYAIHEKLLFEITNYFYKQQKSPITAFVHLYRCLEFMSYCFPMIYASKSKDYSGTFVQLKKFFTSDVTGEIKFFKKFLKVLFEDEESTLSFIFEINIDFPYPLELLETDLRNVYAPLPYEFIGGVLKIKYENMLDFFCTTRNSYFHMCVGQDHNNFLSVDYDIEEYFRSINPYILNWLAIIFLKVSQYGFLASIPGP